MVAWGDLTEVPAGVDAVPALVQLPVRGPGAGPVARTATLLEEMSIELGPHGWKLADRQGMDERRARAYLRDDVEALSIAATGYTGRLVLGLRGPWSLAADLYLARGDRVLSDRGARVDLAASLAVGVAGHIAEVRRQLPGADVVVHVDEPLLAQVGAGVLPTFSGFSRIRSVSGPDVVEGLRVVVDAIHGAGAQAILHGGSARSTIAPIVLAGADGLGVDLAPGRWDEALWEQIATAQERNVTLWAALPAARVSQCAGPDVVGLADAIAVPWRRMGLSTEGLDTVTLLESGSEIAAGTPDAARAMTGNLGRAAAILAERAQD